MRAYIYARFSTLDQARGNSLARQLTDCRAFCDRKGWERSPDRELKDEGRSAFHGANRSAGSDLAEFEQMARRGAVGNDTVLVVERLDRLSRQSPVEVFNLVTSLTEAGVCVATVDGERVYAKGTFDFASLIELVVKAQVSYEESAKKSQRISAVWMHKRTRAEQGDQQVLTRQCPAWLAVDEGSRVYIVQEDRAAIVRRMFDLTIAGFGKHLIASTLNREGVPAWGKGKKSDRGWHASYVQKILVSRSVLGEFQPHRKIAGRRQPEGDVLTHLYPAIIDEVIFSRAQAQREARRHMAGRRGKSLSNLFSGLAYCEACGGRMTFRNKGKPGEQYLVCDNALRSRGCDHRTHFNYPALETAIIEYFLPLALFDRHFVPSGDVHTAELELLNQRKATDELAAREERLVDLISRQDSAAADRMLADVILALREAKDALKQRERDLNVARGKVSPRAGIARVRELLHALQSEDDEIRAPARGVVQAALREVVGPIICDPVNLRTIAHFGPRYICFDRGGQIIETTQEADQRLSVILPKMEREAAAQS